MGLRASRFTFSGAVARKIPIPLHPVSRHQHRMQQEASQDQGYSHATTTVSIAQQQLSTQ